MSLTFLGIYVVGTIAPKTPQAIVYYPPTLTTPTHSGAVLAQWGDSALPSPTTAARGKRSPGRLGPPDSKSHCKVPFS